MPPLPTPPSALLAQLQKKQQEQEQQQEQNDSTINVPVTNTTTTTKTTSSNNVMLSQLLARNKGNGIVGAVGTTTSRGTTNNNITTSSSSNNKHPSTFVTTTTTTNNNNNSSSNKKNISDFHDKKPFLYDNDQNSFYFAAHYCDHNNDQQQNDEYLKEPCMMHVLSEQDQQHQSMILSIPLAPCVYRMTDYTYLKKEPIPIHKCLCKLGVLRCLQSECEKMNTFLSYRYNNSTTTNNNNNYSIIMEEDELSKIRFMELLSNCGIYQKVAELILKQIVLFCSTNSNSKTTTTTTKLPRIDIIGLTEFISTIETNISEISLCHSDRIENQTTNFFPGLGELFVPGTKITCYPEGMEGTPLGCEVVQCWYDEELNQATKKLKRKFVLVIEFIVSVGDELVFVAATDVYTEFHDSSGSGGSGGGRNVPIKELKHRVLNPTTNQQDAELLQKLQCRGEFYASVATKNHYLEYHPNSFYPIMNSTWSSTSSRGNNAVRPLSKGGRIMVDVKRGIVEGHIPIRGTSADGMSDTVKEAIKLFEQSKRTGVAVPFRTCILPGFDTMIIQQQQQNYRTTRTSSSSLSPSNLNDIDHLWQAWPMLTGFSFTARVWGKLLLGMPKVSVVSTTGSSTESATTDNTTNEIVVAQRPSIRKFGGAIEVGALGGVGKCGNCGYIKFQEKAFDQLVLAEDKKELIRAVARNAGGSSGGSHFDDNMDDDTNTDGEYSDDDDDADDIGIDVVANKGAASIFLLHGPPGTGKTLTAEAIAELLRKPLYVVTAGDLGITASEVEKTLGAVLELCQTWDALVLIDEADVFLEARNSHEIERNALVCVMLRLLEYYSGCLFLSSNREASTIDAAIASRITVMLSYPPLDVQGRSKVWKNLIELIPCVPSSNLTSADVIRTEDENVIQKPFKKKNAAKYRTEFTTIDYDTLATGYSLNGRQIKNSIVLGRALARERQMPLSMSIIRRAVTAVAGEDAVLIV